jgi:hypothetical protein
MLFIAFARSLRQAFPGRCHNFNPRLNYLKDIVKRKLSVKERLPALFWGRPLYFKIREYPVDQIAHPVFKYAFRKNFPR